MRVAFASSAICGASREVADAGEARNVRVKSQGKGQAVRADKQKVVLADTK